MTATWSNPRLNALPCERMRGCTFADDFVTLARIADNLGTDTGTGNAADHGLTTTGAGYIAYEIIPQTGGFTVVVRFSATAESDPGILIGNANLTGGVAADGFCVWVDDDGVKANHSNGATIPIACEIDFDYADGEIHTVTYVVNMTGGEHTLYVDALPESVQSTTISETIGEAAAVTVAGDGTRNFKGTVHKARIFAALLTEDEHALYYSDILTAFWDAPYAKWRCDEQCDDTNGNRIWDTTVECRDLLKADGLTGAKFPTLETDKYLFDYVNDYISNLPDLPDEYTISVVRSDPERIYPYIQQDNDTSFSDLLTTEKGYWGYIHSMIIYPKVLTQIEKYHDEYMQLYWLWRGRAYGLYHRLIVEGTCQLAMFLDADRYVYRDFSNNLQHGQAKLVVRDGVLGCTFPTHPPA